MDGEKHEFDGVNHDIDGTNQVYFWENFGLNLGFYWLFCQVKTSLGAIHKLHNLIIKESAAAIGGVALFNVNADMKNVDIVDNMSEGLFLRYSFPTLDHVLIARNSNGGINSSYYYNNSDTLRLKNVTIDGQSYFGHLNAMNSVFLNPGDDLQNSQGQKSISFSYVDAF